MGNREKDFSIYKMSIKCDVEYNDARKVRRYLGFGQDTIKNERDFIKVCNVINTIRKMNDGCINGKRIDAYFKGYGRMYLEEDIRTEFDLQQNVYYELKRVLGINSKVYKDEYELLKKAVNLIKGLYGHVTFKTIEYLQNLMKYTGTKDIHELEEVLKHAN